MEVHIVIWTAVLIEGDYQYNLWQSTGREREQWEMVEDMFGYWDKMQRTDKRTYKFIFNDGKTVYLHGHVADLECDVSGEQ